MEPPPFDLVVSKIFEKLGQLRTSGASHPSHPSHDKVRVSSVMELVAAYVNPAGIEYGSLEMKLRSASNDGSIGHAELKTVFKEWAQGLCPEPFTCASPPIPESFLNLSESYSSSSTGYMERIEELKGEISNRDRIIQTLKRDLETNSQHMQSLDDSNASLSKQIHQLKEKMQLEFINNNALKNRLSEYEEMKVGIDLLNLEMSVLKNKSDKLKKENFTLERDLSVLNEEKFKLLNQLSQCDIEKSNLIKESEEVKLLLDITERERVQFFKTICDQENRILYLEKAKFSLEEEKSFLEESRESARLKHCDRIPDSTINCLEMEEFETDELVTSTPRNQISLQQEMQMISIGKNSGFLSGCDSFTIEPESNFQSDCVNTYTVQHFDIPLFEAAQDELSRQKKINKSLISKLKESKDYIHCLEVQIENMKIHINLYNVYCENLSQRLKKSNMKIKIFHSNTHFRIDENRNIETIPPKMIDFSPKNDSSLRNIFWLIILFGALLCFIFEGTQSIDDIMEYCGSTGIFELEYYAPPPT